MSGKFQLEIYQSPHLQEKLQHKILTMRGFQSEYCHLLHPPNALMSARKGYMVVTSTKTYATTYNISMKKKKQTNDWECPLFNILNSGFRV